MLKSILAFFLIFAGSAYAANMQFQRLGSVDGGYGFFVNVNMNGQMRRMQLDTGAFMTVLKEDSASDRLTSLGQISMSTFTDASIACQQVSIYNLSFGINRFASNEALRCPKSNDLLGANWLDGKVLNLDISDQIVAITDSNEPYDFPLERGPGSHFMIRGQYVSGPDIALMVDTGCSLTSVDSEFIADHPELFVALDESVSTAFGTMKAERRPTYRMSALRVGDMVFENLRVMSLDLKAEQRKAFTGSSGHMILLGANTLILADWNFDLKTNTWAARRRFNNQSPQYESSVSEAQID